MTRAFKLISLFALTMLATEAQGLQMSGTGSGPQRNIDAGFGFGMLPQIADGGYWKTSIVLVNLDSRPSGWTVKFYGDNGNPKEFTLAGRGRATVFNGVLEANGSTVLETLGGPGTLNQGWALVSTPSGMEVGAMAIFGTSGVPTRPDFEASVPAGYFTDFDTMIPYDNTNGFVTSVALLNTSTMFNAVLDVRILDESGLALATTDRITLTPGQKLAFATIDRWPISRDRRGTIDIDELSGNATSLALRFNPSGAFTTIFALRR